MKNEEQLYVKCVFYVKLTITYVIYYFFKLFPLLLKFFVPKLKNIAIEPTNFCNLSCKICFSQNPIKYDPREKGHMDMGLFKKIIDEVASFPHVVSVGLNFGGECLVNKNFCEMLAYVASKANLRIGFHTNGMLLNESVIKTILQFSSKMTTVSISLDGLGKKHENIRIGSNYKIVEQNVMNFVKLRGTRSQPEISVNLAISEHTEQEISDFIDYWSRLVDAVYVFPVENEDSQIIDKKFFSDQYILRKFCTSPFCYLAVMWNGDITSCCADIAARNYLGNANLNSIKEIWQSKEFLALRLAQIKKKFNAFPACTKCDEWKIWFAPYKQKFGDLVINHSGVSKIYKKF